MSDEESALAALLATPAALGVGPLRLPGALRSGHRIRLLAPPEPYTEQFDGKSTEPLVDRCWSIRNSAPLDVSVGGGDLAIRHAEEAAWQSAPTLERRIEGDFLVITKTEASSGIQSNFCGLEINDASGIAVRGGGITASLLVTTYLDAAALAIGQTPEGVGCEDEADDAARALVYAQNSLPESERSYVDRGVGVDGEAEIAVCRRGNLLAYLYRDAPDPDGPWRSTDWQFLTDTGGAERTELIGTGPVQVGLTAAITEKGASERGVEGHFNWALITALEEDCKGALEGLEAPPDD